MTPWDDGTPLPDWPVPGIVGRLRTVVRVGLIALTIFGLLPFVLALRALRRGHTAQRIVSFASRTTLRIMGLPLVIHGTADPRARAFVANHSSWLDIFVLIAAHPLTFVSKAEVAGWPLIGWIARGTGTVFIARRRAQAIAHRDALAGRIAGGDSLLFFPEGTSTDGRRVLPFRATLFAAVLGPEFEGHLVQPVTVVYAAPPRQDPRYYGWWAGMDFAPHFLATLGLRRQGAVTVIFHPAIDPKTTRSRKDLARQCEERVRNALEAALDKT